MLDVLDMILITSIAEQVSPEYKAQMASNRAKIGSAVKRFFSKLMPWNWKWAQTLFSYDLF